MPAPRATGEKKLTLLALFPSAARCVWVILMPVAAAAVAAVSVATTINCHNLCAWQLCQPSLANLFPIPACPHSTPLLFFSLSLTSSQKSAQKLSLTNFVWVCVKVAACGIVLDVCRSMQLAPLTPRSALPALYSTLASMPCLASTRNCRLYSPGTKLAFKVFQLNV